MSASAISTRLYVGGFPPDVRESELAARFAPFGKVCATQLICDSATGAPRGFGYVTLEAEEAAVERCLKVYRGTKWRGQPLHVQPANESYLARLQREWQQAAADEAEAALAAAEAKAERAEVARRQMEAQLVRLSEGFNRQVEEVAELHTKVERARAAARGMVEKEVARSWIVNFVENTGRRGELLRLMASWWDFSEGDLLRCGLLDEPPPPVDVGPDAGITEQFAAFLDREGHSGDSPRNSPSTSRPGSRRGSFS